VFKESEGAIVYIPHEDRKDIHTSVFINSDKIPTYEAKDLGLLGLKFVSEFNKENNFIPEKSFFITDNEQISHFKSVFAAAIDIGDPWIERVDRSQHVPHGRMTFKGEKMSSRLGGVPLALDTINAVIDEVKEKSGDRLAHLSDTEKEKVYFDIALSALRISILRAKPGSNINFDPETSLSFEGDSGPYLEYTHARCSSLITKGEEGNFAPKLNQSLAISGLEIKLAQFSDTLKMSIEDIAPQKLVTYLFELAQEFNSYYAANQIIVEGDIDTEHRLYIVKCVKNILIVGLNTLGINAVERM
jgi:arginyl-tRNA synthetase